MGFIDRGRQALKGFFSREGKREQEENENEKNKEKNLKTLVADNRASAQEVKKKIEFLRSEFERRSDRSDETKAKVDEILAEIQNKLDGGGEAAVDVTEIDNAAIGLIDTISETVATADGNLQKQAFDALVNNYIMVRFVGRKNDIYLNTLKLNRLSLLIKVAGTERHIKRLTEVQERVINELATTVGEGQAIRRAALLANANDLAEQIAVSGSSLDSLKGQITIIDTLCVAYENKPSETLAKEIQEMNEELSKRIAIEMKEQAERIQADFRALCERIAQGNADREEIERLLPPRIVPEIDDMIARHLKEYAMDHQENLEQHSAAEKPIEVRQEETQAAENEEVHV